MYLFFSGVIQGVHFKHTARDGLLSLVYWPFRNVVCITLQFVNLGVTKEIENAVSLVLQLGNSKNSTGRMKGLISVETVVPRRCSPFAMHGASKNALLSYTRILYTRNWTFL